MLLRTFSAHAKVVARDAKEMRNTQDTRTGFVSCKSGRFELFLAEKMRRFSTDEKLFLFTLSVLWKLKKYAHVAISTLRLIEKLQAYLSLASFAFYRPIGYKHFPEYFFNFVRFYVVIHQKIDLKRSSTYGCPFYWESKANKKKLSQNCLDCWDRSFTNSCGPQRKRFHRGKNRKKLLCFLLLSLLFKHFGITKHWNYWLIGSLSCR